MFCVHCIATSLVLWNQMRRLVTWFLFVIYQRQSQEANVDTANVVTNMFGFFYFVTFISKHKHLVNWWTYLYPAILCSLYKVFVMDHLLKHYQSLLFSYSKYSSCSLLFNFIPIGNHHLPFCRSRIKTRESVFILGKHAHIHICAHTCTGERYFED